VNAYTITNFEKKNVWDFPLLLKYRFHVGTLRPFVSAGYYFSRESSDSTWLSQCTGKQGSCTPAGYPSNLQFAGQSNYTSNIRGVVGGAGLEFKTRYITIAPEMRYNRPTYGYPRDNPFTGLVGFTFGKRS